MITDCDRKAEENCRQSLKTFLAQTVNFVDTVKAFFELEKPAIDKFWTLSQRFGILEGCPQVPYYPAEVTEAVKAQILVRMNDAAVQHHNHLSDCLEELEKLEDSFRAFQKSAHSLDWTLPLPLIAGSEVLRPLNFYLDRGSDVLWQFRFVLNRFSHYFDAIKIEDCASIEAYKCGFQIGEDFIAACNEFVLLATVFLNKSR